MNPDQLKDAFSQIIAERRSVRGFKKEGADADTLESIFQRAQNTPSNCNTQPWQVYVASGDKIEELRDKLPAAMMSGQVSLDFPYEGKYDGVYKERQYGATHELYEAMGIDRSDRAARAKAMMENYSFFGAPHVAFLLFLKNLVSVKQRISVCMRSL